jgi:hypothetical protein
LPCSPMGRDGCQPSIGSVDRRGAGQCRHSERDPATC